MSKELNASDKIVLEYLRTKLKHPKCFYCKKAVTNGQYVLNCMGDRRYYHTWCLDIDILELCDSDEIISVEEEDDDKKDDKKPIVHYAYS